MKIVRGIAVLTLGIGIALSGGCSSQDEGEPTSSASPLELSRDLSSDRAVTPTAQNTPRPRRTEDLATSSTLPTSVDGRSTIEDTVGRMKIGSAGFVTSWSIEMDGERKGWISADTTVHAAPGGTVDTEIRRTRAGLEAWIAPGATYEVRPKPRRALPIVKFHFPK